jgi:hypothetical protein
LSNYIKGDGNFYNINPFEFNATKGTVEYTELPYDDTTTELESKKVPLSKLKQKHSLQQVIPPIPDIDTPMVFGGFIENNGDHIVVDNIYTFLNFTYFNQSLYGLEGFDGFTPRSLYPSAYIAFEDKNATNVLLVLDTDQE